jgi:hypothetical protein
MRLLRGLLRAIAVLFNLALGVFLLGIGLIGWSSGEEVRMGVIPGLEGETVATALVAGALLALAATLLSLTGNRFARLLMLLWNVLVVGLLAAAFFRSSYRFAGEEHFYNGLKLFGVAFVAMIGAWWHLRARRHV